MKKVVIDARIVTKQITGAARVVESLISNLGMFPDVKFIIIHLPEFRPTCYSNSNVAWIECNIPVSSFDNLMRVGLIIRKIRPDVVYYPFVDVPLFYGAPTVAVVFDLFFMEDRSYFAGSSWWRHALIKLITIARLRSVAGIIVISKTTGDQVRKYKMLKNIPIEKVDLCLHKREVNKSTPNRFCGLSNRPYLLYVGNNRRHKNISGLVQHYADALRSLPVDHHLYLCGSIDMRYENPNIAIQNNGIKNRVTHLGPVNDNELEYLYQHAQAVVVPSKYEGFGLPALEAASRGKPIICSDISALREVMGDAAIYCEINNTESWSNAIVEVSRNEAFRQNLGNAALLRANQYSPERLTQETINFCLKFAIKENKCAV